MAGALEAFNQLEKRQQIMVVAGIPAAIVILLGYFSWGLLNKLGPDEKLPGFLQRPTGIWVEINDRIAQIKQQEAIIAEGPEIERKLKALSDEIELAKQRLPLESEKTEVRQQIDKFANDISPNLGKVKIDAVRIIEGGVVKGVDYQPITYQIEIDGDLNGIIQYIFSVEKNTRFMMVKSFSLHPGVLSLDPETKRVVAANHGANLEIVTYVYTAGQKKRSN